MTTPFPTDAALGLPYGGPGNHFDGHFDGHPDQWRAYLRTLTGPPEDRPVYEVVPGPPIITLYGYWWQPGLDDVFLELLGEAGYDVRIVQTIGEATLLPRHPVGHVHARGDRGDRGEHTWFVLGGHHFTWASLVGTACQTHEVQARIGTYVEPGDDFDWEGEAAATNLAIDLLRLTIAKIAPDRPSAH